MFTPKSYSITITKEKYEAIWRLLETKADAARDQIAEALNGLNEKLETETQNNVRADIKPSNEEVQS